VTRPTTLADLTSIDLEIQWQRLIAIMDEVDNATVRTSFSTIVGESRDFACILVNHEGVSLCQSSFSPPNFCVVLPRTSKAVLEKYPIDTLEEGDVLVTNDPWLGTGHLPDYIVLTPIFSSGKVIAFMGTVAHLADVGGHSGDIIAPDVFTEGVRIPPAKLYEAGKPNQLLFDLIGQNCRVPDLVLGDLRAIVGTHQVGAKRLKEFLDDYHLPDLVTLSHAVHSRSEALMRQRIRDLPDGTYEFGLDIDGYIDIVHLHATVTIRGDTVYVDYKGTSPQTTKAAINCTFNTTYASTLYPFKCALVPTIPNNEGLFRPVQVTAPEGCILNTTFPHPVQARAKTTNNINQVLFGALWSVFGEHAQAGSGSIWPFSVSGSAPGYGTFSVHILPHGGRGAMRDLDGLVPIAFPHNSAVTPVEVMETRAPILIEHKALLPDSAGAGRRRGGVGQVMTFKNLSQHTINARVRPDKILCAPPGLNGGQPGRTGEVRFNGEVITSFPILAFAPGDEITLRMPGGGGFGPVEERPRALIERDLALGYITPEGARRDYGVLASEDDPSSSTSPSPVLDRT
jgi:N-methylhydantoinase B/oxoprolinase/acetone carboxylase alpha subunit